MADTAASSLTPIPDKKSRSRGKHKRPRETNDTEGSERKHKKSKSSGNDSNSEPEVPTNIDEVSIHQSRTEKKKRKQEAHGIGKAKKSQESLEDNTMDSSLTKKEKKRKEHKKNHKSLEVETISSQDEIIPDSQQAPETVPMDIDSIPVEAHNADEFGQKPDIKEYPFFTQTVSQYLPLFPSGLVKPIEGFADQHLLPLINRYVPSFRGVLLAFRNPRVGEAPGKGSLTEKSATEDVVLMESINEYAVSFGWLTAEVDLFRPARGAWMEGMVNLQGEGHIGVVCWDMFNASIEAARLPHGWRWIDLLSNGKHKDKGKGNEKEKTAEEAKLPTPEPLDNPDDDTAQLHTTGYWVDENGTRIRGGTKLYFRIKHYEVGASGDYGYLSIEGTMLNEEEEKAKHNDEIEAMRRRNLKHGGVLRKGQKRLPEFSMTKFGVDETEDSEAQRAPIFIASRPASRPGSDID
ncbi:uncharacterized protein GGS25DRAFT_394526 [Hypoxylon fragiforme]|uniref:uncharacterized protein n=1 Tax=Hypoxylon fragiforme TaxID=63214 RepID=UPI0020C71172|nr:uncharacterized protein GGS25DRAFT_394526 [Hypoxylon fragiforme]KAI2606523.1 hypothetical protein GGS25DRAFT_394526 [Hypoxylon fragiforme]